MSTINFDKVSLTGFANAASTEVYNIFEVGMILKVPPSKVRQMVRNGTVPQPLHTHRDQRQWTKAMLTAVGITAVTP